MCYDNIYITHCVHNEVAGKHYNYMKFCVPMHEKVIFHDRSVTNSNKYFDVGFNWNTDAAGLGPYRAYI